MFVFVLGGGGFLEGAEVRVGVALGFCFVCFPSVFLGGLSIFVCVFLWAFFGGRGGGGGGEG